MTGASPIADRVCVGLPSAGCAVDEAGWIGGWGYRVSSIGINGGSCGVVGTDGSVSAGTGMRSGPAEEESGEIT
ncbi:MAG: hypothetical protein ABIO65_00960 [Nitrospiria bacterium]